MAIKRASTSTALNGFPKYPSMWDQSTAAATFDCLGTVTVGASVQASIVFAGIPQTYTHLQLRMSTKCDSGSSTQTGGYIRYNSDIATSTTNTNFGHNITVSRANVVTSGFTSTGNVGFLSLDSGTTGSTSVFYVGITDIQDYTSTSKVKVARHYGGYDVTTTGKLFISDNLWNNTAAITSITLILQDGNFAQYSKVSLYGVK